MKERRFKICSFEITPSAFGSSGHKSLTSKINLLPLKIFAIIPGIAAVSGVLVERTTSYL